MIYIFDKKQKINKVFTDEDLTAGHLDFKLNTATTFEFSVPANKALPSGSKYVAVPHPLDDSKFVFLRLTERVDKTDTVDYSAYELAYQELQSYGYIPDKRPKDADALTLMKTALNGTNWELNKVNVAGKASTSFYYVDHLTAISSVVDLLGGEIVFYVEIQGNTISGRYMDYLARQGEDTSKVFSKGSNLLTVERQTDMSSVYTAILPRGKGVQVSGQDDEETPDGYGRRLNIADVEWKKSNGKPLDKAKGSLILGDPDANKEWGHIDGQYRLLLQNYDDVDNVNVLINSAYKTLKSVNHPQIQYSATVADVGGLSLGDTVLIMHGERNLSYKTRVFEVNYDLLAPDQTEISLGDDLTENSIASQVITLGSSQNTLSEQTQWTVAQVGREPLHFGSDYPEHPKVGDIFFKYLPNGDTVVYRWNGTIWKELASSNTAAEISDAVDDAIKKAKNYTDELNEKQANDLAAFQQKANEALDSAAEERGSLATEAQQISSSAAHQFEVAAAERKKFSSQANSMATSASSHADSMANSASAYAKAQASNVLNQAQSELATAKQQLGSEVSKAQSDITATNKQLAGKVSQTDFDKTTGDLSTKYGQVKATADAVTTDVAKYKQNNDKKVSANTASIATMSDQITSKVSKDDFDKATGDLNGKFSQQKQTVDSISKTVTELQAKANEQGQVNQLLNTEFTPDLESWNVNNSSYINYVGINKDAVIKGSNVLNIKHSSTVGWGNFKQKVINFNAGGVISASLYARATSTSWGFALDSYDSDGNRTTIKQVTIPEANTLLKIENVTIPTKAVELYFSIWGQNEGTVVIAQPMLVFDSTVGNYVQGNYNNNSRVAELELGIDHITGLVDDPKNGLSAVWNLATEGQTTAIKAQQDATTAIQTAQGFQSTVESMGKTNQLLNTEFTPDLQSWSASNKFITYAGINKDATVKGSNVLNIKHSADDGWGAYRQKISNLIVSSVLSASVYARQTSGNWLFTIESYDAKGTRTIIKQANIPSTNTLLKIENLTVPSDSASLYFSIWGQSEGTAVIAKPMLTFESAVGNYVAGNYNSNDVIESVRTQLAGQITDEIKDRTSGDESVRTQLTKQFEQRISANNDTLNTRFTQTEKSIEQEVKDRKSGDESTQTTLKNYVNTTVKNTKDDLESQNTQTASQIEQEIQDRKNGDSASETLLKNLIEQRVNDVTSGYSGAIQTMADGIYASVSRPNQLINTEFTPDLQGWSSSNDFISYVGLNKGAVIRGSNVLNIKHSADTGWGTYRQKVNNFVAGSTVSASVYARQTAGNWTFTIDGYDANGERKIIKSVNVTNTNTLLKIENVTIPDDAVELYYSFWGQEEGTLVVSQPMLVFDSKVGTYMVGSATNSSTVLSLLKDNWSIGIADNIGRITSGIIGNADNMSLISDNVTIKSPSTQITGNTWITRAMIKDGAIGNAQIGNAAISSAQIINVDVSKISGNIANFITGNINTLNSHVLYGDTGHLTTVDTGLIINNQDDHLQLSSKGQYDVPTKRAQFELLGYASNVDKNMQGSLNYYKNPHNKGTGLGIRLLGNQILAIDEAVATGNLYLSPYASGQVQVVNRDRNGFQDIKASKFVTSSERKYKSNIKAFKDDALQLIKALDIKQYTKNNADEVGVIADETDTRILDTEGTGVDLYSFISINARAIQQLVERVENLENGKSSSEQLSD